MTLDKPTQYGAFNQRGSKPSVNGLQPLTGSAPLVPQPILKADDHVPAKDTFERVLVPPAPNQALQRSGVTFGIPKEFFEKNGVLNKGDLNYLRLFVARLFIPNNDDIAELTLIEKLEKSGWRVRNARNFFTVEPTIVPETEDEIALYEQQTQEIRDYLTKILPSAMEHGQIEEW